MLKPAHARNPVPPFVSRQTEDAEYYFLAINPPPVDELAIVCGGMELCSADYLVERDTLPYHTVEFIARGRCRFSMDRQSFVLGPGSVYHYGPNTPHRLENCEGSPLLKFFVCLHGPAVDQILQPCFGTSASPLLIAEYSWIHDLFRMLQDCGRRGGPDAQPSCRLVLNLIIDRVQQLAACRSNHNNKALLTFQSCRLFISEHYATIRSVSEVASQCHVHRAYMAQLFARYAQTTPSQLLNHYKMNAAAQLIIEGNLLVKEVAAAIGFDDPLHFSQSFKKFFGVSPRAFANQPRPSAHNLVTNPAHGPSMDEPPFGTWRHAVGG
jgi:AraC-like DNA-binding protein